MSGGLPNKGLVLAEHLGRAAQAQVVRRAGRGAKEGQAEAPHAHDAGACRGR